uniref:Uncharacterized protein n=1 Tax=Cacopsylla melanoneura TaxID=428564 RepID=A0A8D8TV42_9HEMI
MLILSRHSVCLESTRKWSIVYGETKKIVNGHHQTITHTNLMIVINTSMTIDRPHRPTRKWNIFLQTPPTKTNHMRSQHHRLQQTTNTIKMTPNQCTTIHRHTEQSPPPIGPK